MREIGWNKRTRSSRCRCKESEKELAVQDVNVKKSEKYSITPKGLYGTKHEETWNVWRAVFLL